MQDPSAPPELVRLWSLLLARARTDPELCEALRAVGACLAALEAPTATAAAARTPQEAPAPVTQEAAPAPPAPPAPLPPPARAPVTSREEPPAPLPVPRAPVDLALLAARFSLKADGCRWHLQRRKLLADRGVDFPAQVAPGDRDIIDRARALPGGCWMWMCRPESPQPEPARMEALAGCYQTLAGAVGLVHGAIGRTDAADQLQPVLSLLAEALSATRVGLEHVGEPKDNDQVSLFLWLREQTQAREIYIPRYMRLEDPADPEAWAALAAKLSTAERSLDQRYRSNREQKAALDKLRYHVKKLKGADEASRGREWNSILDASAAFLRAGAKPSNTELRGLLLDVLDTLPTDLSPEEPRVREFQPVLREIDRYLAAQEALTTDAEAPVADAPEVREARALVEGRALVLIGGEERREAGRRLVEALGLSRLDWQASRPHESHHVFEPAIAREDVAAVLLAIRWSSHAFTEVQTACDANDKPLVRLPAGYHPNMVAKMLLEQAGKRLGK
ncbi:MAG: hypothetical protein HY909_30260 [Deltaproteobacteria bacterium]|nr:hypothetical protein [Deltaproteobacteria bacterium]